MSSRSSGGGGRERSSSRQGSLPSGSPRPDFPPPSGSKFPQPLGFDPATKKTKQEEEAEKKAEFKRKYATLDLTPEAYKPDHEYPFMKRQCFSTAGKPMKLEVNQFNLRTMGRAVVYQYQVAIQPEPKQQSFYATVFKSQEVLKQLDRFRHTWVHDGRQLAWSLNDLGKETLIIEVDMDKERGRAPRKNKDGSSATNKVKLLISQTSVIQFQTLERYLKGTMNWNDAVLECMNCLDHVLRMGPSFRGMIKIRRNFYDADLPLRMFDNMVGAKKGIYSAFTMNGSLIAKGGMGLAVNVDVANTTFWAVENIARLMMYVAQAKEPRYKHCIPEDFDNLWKPVWIAASAPGESYVMDKNNPKQRKVEPSEAFRHLRILHRIQFTVRHRNDNKAATKSHKLGKFGFDQKYGKEGATSNTVKFTFKGRDITVRQYFGDRYGINLRHPKFPVVETSRAGVFPPEVCTMEPNQKYNFKLTPDQTSQMIRFAVTRPSQRRSDIMKNVKLLQWDRDEWLRDFGITISPQMTMTDAVLLQNPTIQFANTVHNPGVSGRWDMRSKKFLEKNRVALSRWAIVSIAKIESDVLTRFMNQFKNIYRNHGGDVLQDAYCQLYNSRTNLGELVNTLYKEIKAKHNNKAPQMIFVVVADKTLSTYERLKKSLDCRFAVVSQILLAQNVQKCQPQYISNVCMKVNAKLGGCTSRITLPPSVSSFFPRPTMIIGVDVTHPPVGSMGIPSVAAITMSIDKNAVKYMAHCQTNGYRVELLDPTIIKGALNSMIERWIRGFGCLPMHIYYFRDGVGHSMFGDLLDKEVNTIKELFTSTGKPCPKFTVIVAQKRHHIRFFPKSGDRASADRNGNPLPGTLVERDVTHPHYFDFFLSSHSAIQGTARPTHYHVLMDEAGIPVDEVHKILYQQCYQYVRSTTPVSIHPAIYYAHLASRRAAAHEDMTHGRKFKSEERLYFEKNLSGLKQDPKYSEKDDEDMPKLLPMGGGESDQENINHIRTTMWFV